MEQSIGIFDSGIGGLTVAKAILKTCPNEKLIYFGDTAHFPYGDKARYSIQHYADLIADFLLTKHCKAIVIACNTASAIAGPALRKKLGERLPIIDVITPVAELISNYYPNDHIGLIATKGTVNSRIYPKQIHKINPAIQVSSLATPLLAPMIEEGFFNNAISNTIIGAYLDKKNLNDINRLILGCTHYPIIENEIKAYYQSKQKEIKIINSAEIVALKVKEILVQQHLLNPYNTPKPEHEFFVSDYTNAFEKSTKIFFGTQLKLQAQKLF